MPTFSYIGCDAAGANESGTIDAATEKLAYDMLSARGIIVLNCQMVQPLQLILSALGIDAT